MGLITCKYLTILTGGLDRNAIDDVFEKAYESIELEFIMISHLHILF